MHLDYSFFYAEASIVCILILGILLLHSRKYSSRQEKQIWFDRAVIAFMLYFAADIFWAAILGGALPRTRFGVVLCNGLNYFLLGLLSYTWFMYMAASVHLESRNRPMVRYLCLLPLVLSCLLLAMLYAADPLFWVSESLEVSSWYFPLFLAAPLLYLLAATSISMSRAAKSQFGDEAFLFRLIGIFPLGVLLFGLIQTFSLNAPMFCFGCTIMMLYFYIQNLQTLISVDALTRLNNRGQINRYLQQNRYRENVTTYAVMIDVDSFKQINDTYGHAEGDRALILVSEVLKRGMGQLKPAVFLGRYGGDKFVLFFQCAEGDPSPDEMIAQLRASLKEKQQENQLPYPLRISAGYDALRNRNDTLEACMVRADRKLYENKRAAKVGR